MSDACTISCPACRQSLQVWVTGNFVCTECGHSFEVGVYSPPADQQPAPLPTSSDLQLTAGWLHVGNQDYRWSDLVGASISRDDQRIRLWIAGALLAIALSTLWVDEPLLAFGFGLLALSAVRSWWIIRRRYVVSWMTRQGREGRLRVGNQSEAEAILAELRRHLARHASRSPALQSPHSREPAGSPSLATASLFCGLPLG